MTAGVNRWGFATNEKRCCVPVVRFDPEKQDGQGCCTSDKPDSGKENSEAVHDIKNV